jgi:spore cortex formation protein SpoVR/YcgB (stage V sporulation)
MTMVLLDALKKKIEHQKEQDNSVIVIKKGERNLFAQREKRRQRIDEERKDRGYKKLRNRVVVLEQSPNKSAIKLVEGDTNNKSLLLESFEPT